MDAHRTRFVSVLNELKRKCKWLRKMLNKGPYDAKKNKGLYDERRDRIVWICSRPDTSGVGRPFWSITDSDDRALVCYGSSFILKRKVKQQHTEMQRLQQQLYWQRTVLATYQTKLNELWYTPPFGGCGGPGYNAAQSSFRVHMDTNTLDTK